MARGPAQKAAKDVAAPFVRGQHPVADHERGAADVIRDHAQRNVLLGVVAVFDARDLADALHDVLDGVHQEKIVHALHNAREALQPHAGIDIGVVQRRIAAFSVAVELGEHQVPEFDVPVTVAADAAGGLAASVLLAAVEIDFGAGAAGAGSVLPEIVLFAEAHDARGVHPDLFRPDIEGLVVILIDRHPQPVDRKLHHLRAELPRPRGRLVLEIIAERKIAQHLEKGAVPVGDTHPVDIRRADAFLTGGHPLARRGHLPGEIFLHGRHAGIDQQKAVVSLRDQGEARQPQMALGFKKRQIFLADFVQSRPLHQSKISCLKKMRRFQNRASKKIDLCHPQWDGRSPWYHPNCANRAARASLTRKNAGTQRPELRDWPAARRIRGNLSAAAAFREPGFPLCRRRMRAVFSH